MKQRAVVAYVTAVTLCGIGSLAFLPALAPGPPQFLSGEYLLLGAYVVLGELYPLRVPRGGREGVLTVSTTFAFALLLHLGPVEALTALVLASIASDGLRRRAPTRALFNAAQLSLSVVLAAAALHALRPATTVPVSFADTGFVVTAVTGAVLFLTNFVLSGVAVALATRDRVLRLLRTDLLPQATWTVMLLSLSPIVVVAADTNVALLPLFLVPMVAVYKSMDVFLEREQQALLDPVTGLPNRALFSDRVDQAVRRADRTGEPTAVMVLGLDRFKEVNDTLGREGGDRVLRLIAERLTRALRDPDTVARLGGDEFGMVASPVDPEMLGPGRISRILQSIHEPIRIGELAMELEASVGVALAPSDGSDPEALVTYADTAMMHAKRRGTVWEFHEPVRFGDTGNRMALLQGLRTALEQHHLVLHYQPQVNVETGRIEAAEALVRWEDPEQGFIMPDRFIPLAEETGLIRDVTRYVLSSALDMVGHLCDEGHDCGVAVNVCARDFQDPALPEEVAEMLGRREVDPRMLELEVTERTIMSDPMQAAAVLMSLHTLGVRVAVDDFGTGNTSLRLLSDLPMDSLKIDRSLVNGLEGDGVGAGATIVETTIELGHKLGMTVVAEGVETQQMLERLRELRCDSVQGYLYGRPVPGPGLRDRLLQEA